MIITQNNLIIELPNQLKNFHFYSEEPFVIFKGKDFLDSRSYTKLVSEIYKISDFDFIFKGQGEKNKKSINGANVEHLPEGVLKDFCIAILGRQFYSWFKSTHLPYFRRGIFNLYLTNPSNRLFRFFMRVKQFLNLPMFFYFTEIEYSSITTGGFIPPHTDIKSKRLSLVYYLPSFDKVLNDTQKKQLGTVFWKARDASDMNRFDCTLLSGKELSKFYLDYEPAIYCSYDSNQVVGFIKSDKSWHSVEPFAFNYDRRAIVINVYEI